MSNKIQQNILNPNNRIWIDNIDSLVSSFQIFPKKENSKEENFNNISRLLLLPLSDALDARRSVR
jgi:hypothetical protein